MTAEIINLRQVRKARDRAGKVGLAAENRAKFGRTKHERQREEAESGRHAKHLDAHRRDNGGEPDPEIA